MSSKLLAYLLTFHHQYFDCAFVFLQCVACFNVYLVPTVLLKFSGECLLQVTSHDLSVLRVEHPHTVVVSWPLRTIRQYGHPRDGTFAFIAGR